MIATLRTPLVGLLVAVACGSVALSRSVFTPTASDTSAYVTSADLWAQRTLARPVPAQLLPALGVSSVALSPLGFRPGLTSGTEVPAYPPGWPLLMAAATRVSGEWSAAFVLGPLLYAVFAFALFRLTCDLAGTAAGVLASLLAAGVPVTFFHAVHPMSDLPAAALWLVAWYLALRRTASSGIAAGLTAGLAVLARPNLAPLTIVFIALLVPGVSVRREWRAWIPALVFCASASVGVAVLLFTQHALYGSPLASAYTNPAELFSLAYAPTNIRNYARLAYEHVGAAGVALTVSAVALALRFAEGAARRAVASGLGLVVVNVALYVAYAPYDHWPFLRFFLPALGAIAVVSSIGWAAAHARCSGRPARWLVAAAALAHLALSTSHGREYWRYAWNDWYDHRRLLIMGRYLESALPANAIVLGYIHTGVVAHATGKNTVRLDQVAPDRLAPLVDQLVRHGYAPAFVLDGGLEFDQFKARYRGTRFGALDWRPRARFVGALAAGYWLASDLDPSPTLTTTDVLRVQ